MMELLGFNLDNLSTECQAWLESARSIGYSYCDIPESIRAEVVSSGLYKHVLYHPYTRRTNLRLVANIARCTKTLPFQA